jgi:hypothetical protein
MRLEFVTWITVGFLAGGAFYMLWTKPYNDRLNSVMDCMDESGDTSKRGYDICMELEGKNDKTTATTESKT